MDDPLLLARTQFGINIGFHILFPALTIALAWFLLAFRIAYQRTRDFAWLATYRLWVKIFALTFAMGVVSGVVMSFQFGTNWPRYMTKVGAIAGPLLAYEVLTAFFLEATFLGVMLFGMSRVPDWLHIVSSTMVAIGTTVSAFWILALNSWMHTPAGHVLAADGQWIAASWWDVVFNPSFPYRFTHMMIASGLTTSFVVAGLSAWRLLRASSDAGALKTLRIGLGVAAVLAPLQIYVGDQHGLETLRYQPAKIAAIEAIWHTQRGAPLTLVGIPDETEMRTRYALEVPRGASLILRHSPDAEIKGIDAFPDHPPVGPVFFAFRLMVGIAFLMVVVAWTGSWLLRGGRRPARLPLWILAGFTFSGWVAVDAGWIVTEIGRQPWVVTGVLRTADAAGDISGAQLGASLTLYIVTYALLFVAYIVVLTHLAGEGASAEAKAPPGPEIQMKGAD